MLMFMLVDKAEVQPNKNLNLMVILTGSPARPAPVGHSGHGVGSMTRFPDLHGDQHDVEELLVPPAVDDDVDGGVDDQREVVDVDQVLDPVGPLLQLSVEE